MRVTEVSWEKSIEGDLVMGIMRVDCYRRFFAVKGGILILAALILFGGSSVGNSEPSIREDRTPVVLVHGLHGGILNGRFGGIDQMKSFASFLERNGYRTDSNLTVLDYSGIRDSGSVFVAQNRLREAIAGARGRTGAGKVDIVAQGFGALVARRYLDMGGEDVRTLVMVSPPNRGSFVATLMRMAAEVERHGRGIPSLRNNFASEMDFTDFDGPFPYVERRSVLFYEPLYKEYLLENEVLLVPWKPPSRDSRGFEEWFANTKPDLYRNSILDRQVPVPGTGLTMAYYELVALNLARYRVVASGTGSRGLGAVLFDRPYVSTDWREMLLHYLKKIGVYVLERLAQVVRARAPNFLAKNAALAFGVDPMGKSMEEMVSETISFPEGRDSFGRPVSRSVLINHDLRSLNEREKARRTELQAVSSIPKEQVPDVNVKYVIVSGKIPNLWALLDSGVPDNDSVVTVESTCLPLADNDVFRVFNGLLGPNHLSLIASNHVRDFVLNELRSFHPIVSERIVRVGDTPQVVAGDGNASWSRPGYVRIGLDRDRSGFAPGSLPRGGKSSPPAAKITVNFGSSADATGRAWVYAVRPDGSLVKRSVNAGVAPGSNGKSRGGELVIPGIGNEYTGVMIGFRSVGDIETFALMGSQGAGTVPIAYSVEFSPFSPGLADRGDSGWETIGSRDTVSRGSSAVGLPAGTRIVAAGPIGSMWSKGEPRDGLSQAEVSVAHKTPQLVHVKYRTKHTTLKPEAISRHSEWRWDFGDGTSFVDPDGSHTSVEVLHRYAETGRYRVTATSMADGGRPLRTIEWEIEIPQDSDDSLERSFAAQTSEVPEVDVRVLGPKRWITGRAATFEVKVSIADTPFAVRHEVEVDPSPQFLVLWDRPGKYEVQAAVTIKTTYEFPEGPIVVRNTYLGKAQVEVLATSVSD